jgi:hypothetical protein
MKPQLTALMLAVMLSGCAEKTLVSPAQEVIEEKPAGEFEWLPVHPMEEDTYFFQKRLTDTEIPNAIREKLTKGAPNPNMRKFPYPYRGMLAIASDIDDTTPEEFAEYHRFLNTKEETPYGPGVGLDVGDSMWMYMSNDRPNITDKDGHGLERVMTYFEGTNPNKKHFAEQIKHYFQVGWIDSMHTFGDFSRKNVNDVTFKRELAVKAWEEMKKEGILPTVWINHGNEANVDSFGAYDPRKFSRYQAGDNPKSPAYHTDLTIQNGVHFVWNSIGEAKFGQDSPIFPISLRDGQKIWGFHRYTNEVVNGKNDWTWVPREIHRQITKERLDALAEKGQYAIVGQHFGGYNIGFPFDEKGIKALRMLESYQDQGKILVARTSRLLNYAVAFQFVQTAVAKHDGETWINITGIHDPLFGPQPLTVDAVRGLTFYVDKPERTRLLLDLKPIDPKEYQINPPDHTGRASIGIKWFPRDVRDHTYEEQKAPASQ